MSRYLVIVPVAVIIDSVALDPSAAAAMASAAVTAPSAAGGIKGASKLKEKVLAGEGFTDNLSNVSVHNLGV